MTSSTTWQHINTKKCTNVKKKLAMVAVVSALASVPTAMSVPVVPNNTGWQYSVTGSGVNADGNLTPTGSGSISNTNVTLDGVTSTWNGLNLEERPNFTIATPGASFQFTETYQGPGLSNHTIIQRTTTINSVTDTTSTFTQ